MNKSLVLVIISLLTTTILFAQEQNSKDLLLISSLKNYEMDAHITFQNKLYQSSENFIQNQS